MTLQNILQFTFVKKSGSFLSWSDDIEFLNFRYAAATYDNGILCIKPCGDTSNRTVKCKEVKHFGRKFYLAASYKIPNGYYALSNVDTTSNTICFRKIEENQTEKQFNPEEWLNRVKEKLSQKPWASGTLWNGSTLLLEVVRIGESEDVMVRIRTPSMKNAIKLTKKEHIDSLIALAHAIASNERQLKDKLEALMQILPKARRREPEEEI